VTLEGGELTVVALADGFSPPIEVGVGEELGRLDPGEHCSFAIGAGAGVA
jgi:hypothetical protein